MVVLLISITIVYLLFMIVKLLNCTNKPHTGPRCKHIDTERGNTMVLVKEFEKVNGVLKSIVCKKQYSDIDLTKFDWKLIEERGKYGWVMQGPPPEPTIIASDGMLEIANEILNKG